MQVDQAREEVGVRYSTCWHCHSYPPPYCPILTASLNFSILHLLISLCLVQGFANLLYNFFVLLDSSLQRTRKGGGKRILSISYPCPLLRIWAYPYCQECFQWTTLLPHPVFDIYRELQMCVCVHCQRSRISNRGDVYMKAMNTFPFKQKRFETLTLPEVFVMLSEGIAQFSNLYLARLIEFGL